MGQDFRLAAQAAPVVLHPHHIPYDGLTKDLVDELIKRIEAYGEDRIEIRWKFYDNILLQNMDGRVLRVTSF